MVDACVHATNMRAIPIVDAFQFIDEAFLTKPLELYSRTQTSNFSQASMETKKQQAPPCQPSATVTRSFSN